MFVFKFIVKITNSKTWTCKIWVYINLYISSRFWKYTLHRGQGHSFVVHFRIFLLNSLKIFEHFKFFGTKFQIWAPKEAIVFFHTDQYLHYYVHCRRASLGKLCWWFLIWNTSFIIAVLLWTLNISIDKVCRLCW